MPKRRKYSQEYKREAVLLAQSADSSVRQVAQDLGINASMLGRWCREAAREGNRAFRGQGVSRDVEVTALKRELARVKKERDFLREAATFFARESS